MVFKTVNESVRNHTNTRVLLLRNCVFFVFDAASLGNQFPTFGGNVMKLFPRVYKSTRKEDVLSWNHCCTKICGLGRDEGRGIS